MISVIDYDGGNFKSVINILKRLKVQYNLTTNKDIILKSKSIILPGVSNFGYCINSLKSLELDKILHEAVIEKEKNILGICSGMQSFATYSEESNSPGLNFIKGTVKKIDFDKYYRSPHMGWNKVDTQKNKLFKNIKNNTRFYFCHSFHFKPLNQDIVVNYTKYKKNICAAINYKNIYGVQFHPEKSFIDGYKLIQNFIENSE